ncbi:hypothetical protein DES53_102890 [Roseimicrobium gellanilyticum]|uniref:Uncharacterized protein n=1 Tax=Roseimicrobium gellanilyticum TaxID=748857 RepID=A0A366HTC0_9BACT|nr:hypothetical protein DES53_102890 [Roseimicrobium gellanilyticum]
MAVWPDFSSGKLTGAVLYGDPPTLLPIVGELGISADDSLLQPYTEPFEQR